MTRKLFPSTTNVKEVVSLTFVVVEAVVVVGETTISASKTMNQTVTTPTTARKIPPPVIFKACFLEKKLF